MISRFMVRLPSVTFANPFKRLIISECPGLAEWESGMEVKNPLFSEETPAAKPEKAQQQTNKAANQK